MATAELAAEPLSVAPKPQAAETGADGRLPFVVRPLHRMWRRAIDSVELTSVDLPVRRLPGPLAGLVACQLSDLHLDRDEDIERLERAVAIINGESPDLVFLTGDYFSGPESIKRYLGAFRELIHRLNPSTAVIAIAGNHDHWSSVERVFEALNEAGAEVLANQNRRLRLRGESLVIVGIDDLWSRRAEPSRAFSGVRPGDCTVVLAHNPDTALYARHLRPGVMISGHTHGGVVRIPLYGSPLRSVLRLGKRFYSGLNRYEDFFIYTNRGLGTFWLRIRFNCRPEVSRFSLMALEDGADARVHAGEGDSTKSSSHPHSHPESLGRATGLASPSSKNSESLQGRSGLELH